MQMELADFTEDASTIRNLELFAPHAEVLLANSLIRQKDFSLIADGLGRHYCAVGRYSDAKALFTQALAFDEKTFEPGHPNIASGQSNLALVQKGLGQLEEARDLLRQSLASDEKTFEPGHPSIASDQSNLAAVLTDLGQLQEARDLLRQALTR
jgi:tetratricopeptide (TPR) repeat protein